jgi:hypothetical protein
MTNTTKQPASKKNGNVPTHIAYHVLDAENGVGFWKRIGSAWANKDAKGFNIQINAIPLHGRIILRRREEKPD